MGASFSWTAVSWPVDTMGTIMKSSPELAEAVLARWRVFLATADAEDLTQGRYEETDEGWRDEVDAEVSTFVRDAFSDDNLGGELGWMELRFMTRPYLFTAGQSWGDSPTEYYDAITMLATSDVTIEPFDIHGSS
jgi:hypothetical protein